MIRSTFMAAVGLSLVVTVQPVVAEETPVSSPNTKLALSGVAFARYYYMLEDIDPTDGKKDMNSFDVDRVYLTGNYQVDERYKWTTTLEMRNTSGKLDLFLKKAYLTVTDPLHIQGTSLFFGQFDHPQTVYQEKVWAYRVVSQVPVDKYFALSSAQVGAGFEGVCAKGRLGWATAISNEKPYNKESDDKYKTGQVRVVLTPRPEHETRKAMKLAAFYQISNDAAPTADNLNQVVGVQPYFKNDRLTASVEFDLQIDKHPPLETAPGFPGESRDETRARILSAYVTYKTGEKTAVFGRVDQYDRNTDLDDDALTRVVAGVARTCAKGVRAVLDLDVTSPEEATGVDLDQDLTASARVEVTL